MVEPSSASVASATSQPSEIRQLAMALLRIAIGWHFLYEGLIKLQAGDWSAAGYLSGAVGPAADFYHSLANNAT